jgi:hydrogenase maturation protease
MTDGRILIACIGNIFMGDDGFGTEVARRLAGRALPSDVVLKDFGIRGLDLTYALLEPWDLVILVDACGQGGEPGTVYLIEPDATASTGAFARMDAHAMNPMSSLQMVRAMGGTSNRVVIVGCQPADLGGEDGRIGLSEPVAAAVGEAVLMIEGLMETVLQPN